MPDDEERLRFEQRKVQRIDKLLAAIESQLAQLGQTPERDEQIRARIQQLQIVLREAEMSRPPEGP
jgi:cell division protein FtsB